MDSADPYSDGILKMPIVIDNVSESNKFNYWLLISLYKKVSTMCGI
jgi:hypothetical protein